MRARSWQALRDELRRRKVVRVAAVYAATAFVVLQAADLILPALAVPEWTYRLLVLLALFGFPVALALGWALELTPGGVRTTTPAPPADEPLPSLLGRRTIIATALLVMLGVGLGAGLVLAPATGRDRGPSRAGSAVDGNADRSIAVLPFSDLSSAGDQKWFADGIAEEILTSLARLPELRVVGRSSSFLFAAGTLDDRVIADTLGVAHLVKGSVRRVGEQLRVTAQLVRAADGVQLWSEAYDRSAADLLEVQRDVAEKVAASLDVVLDDERRERMFAAGTRNVEAFEAYLRGRAVYGAAAFVVVQAADIVFPRLALPDWTVTLVVALALLGLVPALALAWHFDATPDGMRRTARATPDELAALQRPPCAAGEQQQAAECRRALRPAAGARLRGEERPMTQRRSSLPLLLAELKRRNVFRVAAVYGATAFVALQVADLVFARLGLPDWTVTLVVALGVIGFPTVTVLVFARLVRERVCDAWAPVHAAGIVADAAEWGGGR